jgi:hypothetical protein
MFLYFPKEEAKVLMRKLGITSARELCNCGLSLLDWVISEAEAGRQVGSIDVKGESYKVLNIDSVYGKKSK